MNAEVRVAELERALAHEVERYLNQLHLRERAEHTAAQIRQQLAAQIRGNAKLLAQLKIQGAALRAAGIEDRPLSFDSPVTDCEGSSMADAQVRWAQ